MTVGRRVGGRLICAALLLWGSAAAAQDRAPAKEPAKEPGHGQGQIQVQGKAQGAPAQSDELFLEVTLNGEATGSILRFTRGKTAGLRSSVQNLRELELDPKLFGLEGREEFDLDDVKGLIYSYDESSQSLTLRVADELRTPLALAGRTVRRPGTVQVTPGAVINYDVFTTLGKDASASVSNELRYFNAAGVLSSTGIYSQSQDKRQFIRLDTNWVHSDPDTLEVWQAGDFISSSLTWTRSLRMGGLQWRKSFDLRPDLLTYPVATLGGSAVVPSAVSLYINGVRQVDTAVPSGPFVINQVSGINGAGQATLVTRDTAGRTITTTMPLYVDTRLLADGLTDYSVEVGLLRRSYTTASFDYARTPAASGSLRYGASDTLTLEAHGEAGRGVVNGGGGLLWRMGQAGVVSASLAGSGGAGNGGQVTAGYQYLSSRFSVDLQSQRASRGYSDLGTADSGGGVLASDRINLSMALFAGQSVGLSLVTSRTPLLPPARIAALSYSASLGLGLFLSVSGYRDYRDDKSRGVYFSVSGTFGDRISANVSRGRQNDVRTTTTTVQRSADYGGGFGWALQSTNTNGSSTRQAQGTYLSSYGQATAYVQDNGSTRRTSADLAGALVLMDGSVHAARQVGAGFALVSTDGVGGVPVMQENRPIGVTGSGGYLLVPNLNPYLSNRIGLDTSGLPLDARVVSTTQDVVPARLSGVLAHFPVEKYQAVSVILHGADGKPLAAGIEVTHLESGATTVIGFDGVAFIDHLVPLNHLQLTSGGVRCVVEFPYDAAASQALPTIGPFVCRGVQ